MAQENMAYELFGAVREAIRNAEARGETSYTDNEWHDIKRLLVREHPYEFQQAIDASIAYNGGVYSEYALDRNLKFIYENMRCRAYPPEREEEIDRG